MLLSEIAQICYAYDNSYTYCCFCMNSCIVQEAIRRQALVAADAESDEDDEQLEFDVSD